MQVCGLFYGGDEMKIFLVSGKAGSGKNEVAKIIKENLPKTVITSFSKYIKMFVQETTSWDGYDETKPRALLQETGDILRSIDSSFLTKRFLEDCTYYKLYYENIVVSDVRLLSEINYLKENSPYEVITIRVNGKSKRNLTEEERHHHTETELDNYENFDYIIENNFDEDLIFDVKNILKGLNEL